MNDAIKRYTLQEWIKHPTTILLILSVSAVWFLMLIVTNTANNKSRECLEQVVYLRDRVEKLEKQTDEYVRAIMQRDLQIRSLKDEGGSK